MGDDYVYVKVPRDLAEHLSNMKVTPAKQLKGLPEWAAMYEAVGEACRAAITTPSVEIAGELSIYRDDLRGGEITLPEIDGEDLGEILHRSLPDVSGPHHGRCTIVVIPPKDGE